MIFKNSEKKDNNRLSFQVESDAAEFQEAIRQAYLKNKKQISIPGFRKGKAPLAIVEGMFGKEVFDQDALDDLAQPAFDKGVEEGKVNFIGMPSITAVEVTEDRTALYTFEVELYPEVELGQYKGLEVEEVPVTVSDEDIDREIDAVRRRNARKVSVEDRPAEKGDTVNIDYEGFLDKEKTQPFEGGKGENHDLELGSNSFVPGFEDQVVGMSVEEEKDINITFPEQYAEDLAGKDVVFHVKVNSIMKPELPEADDDFAQDVSEFDTFAEYRESVRKEIEGRRAEQAKNAFRSAAVDKAIETMKTDVPETMVKAHIESIIRNFAANYGMDDRKMDIQTLASALGIDEEAMNSSIRPSAFKEAQRELLIRAIVEEEKIEPTEEDLKAYVDKLAERVGATADDIRKYFGADYIAEEYKQEKAVDVIVDTAVRVAPKAEEAAENTESASEEKKAPAKKRAPRKKKADAEATEAAEAETTEENT